MQYFLIPDGQQYMNYIWTVVVCWFDGFVLVLCSNVLSLVLANVMSFQFTLVVWLSNQKVCYHNSTLVNNTSLAAPGAIANCLQRRTACKTQNGHQGAVNFR